VAASASVVDAAAEIATDAPEADAASAGNTHLTVSHRL